MIFSEATCDTDFTNPDRQFVGYTGKSYSEATKVLNTLPESPYDIILPAKEAELLKYINNLHGTLEIMESNHYYEVCQKEKLDYERVIKAAVASKWIGPVMSRHYRVIWHKGYRGFVANVSPRISTPGSNIATPKNSQRVIYCRPRHQPPHPGRAKTHRTFRRKKVIFSSQQLLFWL